ncbi:DUF2285 domain-containing protein [Gluconacetobacter aggeris]|uniref:DUF2285 domain-containing protein n=1 Tax=Gluconacetobacter aggeris TaxID=1286186 RepID=A0A7W4NXE8_9PROT|nr:DUF2285 domain-containing protein [Gluconacetobacter aggeris]MBB2169662.1 DUF2285 domain-containing protein [Gluconacetobacter aggeris]
MPTVLVVRPLISGQSLAPYVFDIRTLPDVRVVETTDGVYVSCVCGGVTWQLWMEKDLPGQKFFAFDQAYDGFTPLRAHEAIRFWRVLGGLSDPGPWRRMPPHVLNRYILALRVADARAAGASERQIAESLLDLPPRHHADWSDLSVRSQVRRLDRLARRMTDGGYRDLMGYPLSTRRP